MEHPPVVGIDYFLDLGAVGFLTEPQLEPA